ncbi:MAG: SDR family oxidoreductase [Candidatus Thorarchaeota archaeon]
MSSILVLGATGYIGSRLVPRLINKGHRVRCLVRNIDRARKAGLEGADLIEGDALRPETLACAFNDIYAVYYLIHSMGAGEEAFEQLDLQAARNTADAARRAGVRRIIYLGGLGKKGSEQSPHLRSRHRVAEVLRESDIQVTEFRAAVVVGTGGISFEMVHHLVNRLPFMICPRWVNINTQPVALSDVLRYLAECLAKPETAGKTIDIGGPDILTYREMMLTAAKVLGLRRLLVQVPVLTPRLSSWWLKLVTPLPVATARALIESVRSETICENDLAQRYFDFRTASFEEAARLVLTSVRADNMDAIDPASTNHNMLIDPSHYRVDRRRIEVPASADTTFRVVSSIGGENGWYFADWLWRTRGVIDRLLGGIGMRRGKNHAGKVKVGDKIDFWRVERFDAGRRLLLRAEMNVWGKAWLEFEVRPLTEESSELIQTAWYYPRGLFGLVYWYVVLPVHIIVFKGMANAIARRSLQAEGNNEGMEAAEKEQ